MTPRRRPALRAAPLTALLLLAVTACSSYGDAGEVVPPTPDAAAARICDALLDAVPDSVAGLERRETEPASRFTTAWGDPAVVLRCGVVRPEEMNNPRAPGARLGGVDWMLEDPRDGRYRCTTALRKVYVEVAIPGKYGDVQALEDLAPAIRKTVPAGV